MNNETKKTALPKLRFPEFEGAGEWQEKELGKIGKFTGGGTPSKEKETFWQGNIPWISSSDIYEDSIHQVRITRFITEDALRESATKLIPKNSILLVSRVGVGKLAVTQQAVCTSQDFTNFTPTKDDLVFLAYYLKTQSQALLSYSQGMAIKGFTKEDVSTLKLFLPPFAEQQKIASALSFLDDLLTAQSAKLAALQAHKRGLMQGLFPAEGETVPKLRFPEFQEAEEWEVSTLVELAKFRRGSFPQPYGLPEWYDDVNGMPFIQVFDVDDNFRLKPKTKNKISQLAAKQSVFIPEETVIVTLQGSIGRVAITQYDAYIDRTLLILKDFLFRWIRHFLPMSYFFYLKSKKKSLPVAS